MTQIFVYDLEGSLLEVLEGPAVADHLAALGVDYERWALHPLHDASPEGVLAVYSAEVQALSERHGYQSVDVVRMTPDHPQREAARAKFRDEHIHEDDETRFFVEGSGIFYLRFDERVHAVVCRAGDLLRVPARTRHWFDMGRAPSFCAIRLFRRPDGWVASFTGDPIAASIADYDGMVSP
jgi:1,2-dihydroxy-3-keto-5-methylthiopentene dioxygenase